MSRCFTLDGADRLVQLRADPQLQARIDELADKCTEGNLTEVQMETLQAVVDNGEADTLLEAAELLDYQATHMVGGEPGPDAG